MNAPTPAAAPFIENVGQLHPAVRFQAPWGRPTVQLTDDAIWLTAVQPTCGGRPGPVVRPEQPLVRERGLLVGASARISFIGREPSVTLEPFEPHPAVFSYLRGREPDGWHTHVPAWSGTRLGGVYPGVDVELTSLRGRLEMSALAASSAPLGAIRLLVEGATHVGVLDSRTLSIGTVVGPLTLPLIPVDGNADRPKVRELGAGVFEVQHPFTEVDVGVATEPLTAHLSRLSYATYLGAGHRDDGWSIAVDRLGAAYVTGFTESVGFPATPGAFSTSLGPGGVRRDAFVSKFEPTPRGVRLVYATFIGSNTGDEDARGIAVDGEGVAHVVGSTSGDDFPTTPDAFQPTNRGGSDGFLVKLAPLGDGLVYSTFIGGTGGDVAWDVAIGTDGSDFVTGSTRSADFPVGAPAGTPMFQSRWAGQGDGFLMRLSASGQFQWATYLGGTDDDVSMAVDVNQEDVVAIAGLTFSEDFPVAGAAPAVRSGSIDAFVAAFAPEGALIYSRCLGGSSMDAAYGVALDVKGSAYITGFTSSTDFPVTAGAYSPKFRGGSVFPSFMSDAFVTKLWPDGTLAFSTFLGGSQDDFGMGVAVLGDREVYVSGWTFSPDFPTTPDAYDRLCGTDGNCNYLYGEYAQDIFLAVLDGSGRRLLYSTFLGGREQEGARALALDPDGSVWIAGYTNSADFPVTPDAFAPFFGGGIFDVVVVKLGWER